MVSHVEGVLGVEPTSRGAEHPLPPEVVELQAAKVRLAVPGVDEAGREAHPDGLQVVGQPSVSAAGLLDGWQVSRLGEDRHVMASASGLARHRPSRTGF